MGPWGGTYSHASLFKDLHLGLRTFLGLLMAELGLLSFCCVLVINYDFIPE